MPSDKVTCWLGYRIVYLHLFESRKMEAEVEILPIESHMISTLGDESITVEHCFV